MASCDGIAVNSSFCALSDLHRAYSINAHQRCPALPLHHLTEISYRCAGAPTHHSHKLSTPLKDPQILTLRTLLTSYCTALHPNFKNRNPHSRTSPAYSKLHVVPGPTRSGVFPSKCQSLQCQPSSGSIQRSSARSDSIPTSRPSTSSGSASPTTTRRSRAQRTQRYF